MIEQDCVHEIHDGMIVDMRIEYLLSWTLGDQPKSKDFSDLFTVIVREYINSAAPYIVASAAFGVGHQYSAVMLLQMLRLEFRVAFSKGHDWPDGGFPHMPEAKCAVSLSHGEETWTEYSPGRTINQAAIAAIVQLARDIATERLNEPELTFH